jgi:hypothetical protein
VVEDKVTVKAGPALKGVIASQRVGANGSRECAQDDRRRAAR